MCTHCMTPTPQPPNPQSRSVPPLPQVNHRSPSRTGEPTPVTLPSVVLVEDCVCIFFIHVSIAARRTREDAT